MSDNIYAPSAATLTEAAATYGDALALGIRARIVGAWYAEADKAEATMPTRDALARALAAERARMRSPKATEAERADIASALTVSPATITQAANAYRAVVASGWRGAASDADNMQTAAEALGSGYVAATLISTCSAIAKMPESARLAALTDTLRKARGQAAEDKASKAAARVAAKAKADARPEAAKTRDALTAALTEALALITSATKALGDAAMTPASVAAANAKLTALTKALGEAKAAAALTPAERKAGALAAKAKADAKAPRVTKAPAKAKATPAKAPVPTPADVARAAAA